MKICTKCLKEKPLSEFARKNGKWASRCKICHNLYYKEYYSNPDKRKAQLDRVREYRVVNKVKILSEKYGVSELEIEELMARIGGLCHLCQSAPGTHVDHDHATGELRGYLCRSCNVGLGMLGDTVRGLERAIRYLQQAPASERK